MIVKGKDGKASPFEEFLEMTLWVHLIGCLESSLNERIMMEIQDFYRIKQLLFTSLQLT